MRLLYTVLVLITLASFIPAQEKAPLQQNERIKLSLKDLLRPGDGDKAEAKRLGVKVFRILPRETYEGKIAMRGGGAYYSFVPRYGYVSNETNPSGAIQDPVVRAHTEPETSAGPSFAQTARLLPPHYYGFGSDLELQQGKFIVGFAGADYGFLYDLSEFPLELISTETPEAVFLNSYEPPSKMTEMFWSR